MKGKIKRPFGSTWKRHRISQCLAPSLKGKHKKNEKDKEFFLGQHERHLNVSMNCIISKRKTKENMIKT
jgi:hypothetical protein